jgi:predicted nuclease of predicted toxin-antitoxin system
VKFVVDAHLPRRLAYRLREMGYDTLHTLDLPKGNRTTDAEINRIAEQEQRIVVTKDADFVSSLASPRLKLHFRPITLLSSIVQRSSCIVDVMVFAIAPAAEGGGR